MEKFHFNFILLVLLSSCNGDISNPRENLSSSNDKSLEFSWKNQVPLREWIEDTTLLDGSPEITPLPFGPPIKTIDDLCYQSELFYYKIIGGPYHWNDYKSGYTKTYLFPPVSFLNYKSVDSDIFYGMENCFYLNKNLNPAEIEHVSLLTKYKIRLPDIGGFQVFYMSNEENLFQDFMEICQLSKYGVLIIYDKSEKKANLLTVFYEVHGESTKFMYFYIDKKYNIYLCEISYYGSEDESEGELHIERKYEVKISQNGEFLIKELYNND